MDGGFFKIAYDLYSTQYCVCNYCTLCKSVAPVFGRTEIFEYFVSRSYLGCLNWVAVTQLN